MQWQSLPEHEEEFSKLKNVLSGKLTVHPYDLDVPVTILTCASRLFGLGFAMVQYIAGKTKIVLSHTYTEEICNHRIGVSGNQVCHPEV